MNFFKENSIVPEESILFAKGPAFKQNFLIDEKKGIERSEIYSLMYFLIGLDLPIYQKFQNLVRKIVDNSYYEAQTNLMESHKKDMFYYFNFMKTRNEALFEHEKETFNIYKTVRADNNEFYILMLILMLMFFIILVQLKSYGYVNVNN